MKMSLTMAAVVCLAAATWPLPAQSLRALDSLRLERVLTLDGELHHVQGIDLDGRRLWVTSVDNRGRKGYLHEFGLPGGKAIRTVAIQSGERYHPGGIAAFQDSIWIPVAEYHRAGSSSIQKRNRNTLELEFEFQVPDHIGCVAAAGNRIFGGNWDSRQIYVWDHSGKLLAKHDNPTGNRFQDLKMVNGRLVGSGLMGAGGAVDWMEPASLKLLERLQTGITDRGIPYTQEGMTIRGGRLYLLPEDGPSRLFVFHLH